MFRNAALPDTVHSVLERVTGQENVRALTDEDLLEVTREIEVLGRMLEARRVWVAGEIDARSGKGKHVDPETSLAHRHDCSSALELLKRITLDSASTLSSRIRLARATRHRMSLQGESLPALFPHVAQALDEGRLPVESAATITRELQKVTPSVDPELLELAERTLVDQATGADAVPEPADSVRILTYGWTTALDQDGKAPDDRESVRRSIQLGRVRNGLVPLRGSVVPEVAALLGTMFDAVTSPRVAFVPVDETDVTQPAVDNRTPDQKRHDAFAMIVQRAATHPDMPQLGGAPVTLVMQVREEDLTERQGTAWVNGAHGEATPVSILAAQHVACSGSVLRVTQDDTGRVINLETPSRIFNAHQRRAIFLRDGGCIIPGCETPANWCEIHHVKEWKDGGKTHTDNGVTLCWYHHRYLERHRWNIRMMDGVPQVQAPSWIDPYVKWRRVVPLTKPPEMAKRRPRAREPRSPDLV